MPRYLLEGRNGWEHRSWHGSLDDAQAAAQAELGAALTTDDRGRLSNPDGEVVAKISRRTSGTSGRHTSGTRVELRVPDETVADLDAILARDGGNRTEAIVRAVRRYARLKRG